MAWLTKRMRWVRDQARPYWNTIVSSGSLHLMSANLFNQALGFISSLLVVRFLKPEELGEARVITTYLGYLQLVGCMGLTASILAYVPRSNEPEVRRRWLRLSLVTSFTVTAVLAMAAGWLSWQGWLMSNPHTARWFRWSLMGGLATAGSSILISFYQAERAVRKLAGIQTAVRVAALFIVIAGAWIAGFSGYIVAGIVSAFLMFTGLVCVSDVFKGLRRHVPLPVGYLKVAGFALVGTLLWTAMRTSDVVILDRLATDRALFGCYALAGSVAAVLTLVNQTVQTLTVPFFAARHEQVRWVLRNSVKWQVVGALLSALGAFGIFVVAAGLIGIFYGRSYAPAVSLLLPILLAQCLLATFHIQAGALVGLGLVRVNTILAAMVMPLSVGLCVLMAKRYGIWGAAWSQAVSSAVYALVQGIYGWKALSDMAQKSTLFALASRGPEPHRAKQLPICAEEQMTSNQA